MQEKFQSFCIKVWKTECQAPAEGQAQKCPGAHECAAEGPSGGQLPPPLAAARNALQQRLCVGGKEGFMGRMGSWEHRHVGMGASDAWAAWGA